MITANIPNSVRRSVYRRDGYRCALCDSATGLQIHHIVHRSEGGSNCRRTLLPSAGSATPWPTVPGCRSTRSTWTGVYRTGLRRVRRRLLRRTGSALVPLRRRLGPRGLVWQERWAAGPPLRGPPLRLGPLARPPPWPPWAPPGPPPPPPFDLRPLGGPLPRPRPVWLGGRWGGGSVAAPGGAADGVSRGWGT